MHGFSHVWALSLNKLTGTSWTDDSVDGEKYNYILLSALRNIFELLNR
jgi:hypothetical protein